MLKSKQFNKAQEEYKSLLEEDDLDWIKTVATLIETDQVDRGQRNPQLSKNPKKNNPCFHDEMSNIYSIEERPAQRDESFETVSDVT